MFIFDKLESFFVVNYNVPLKVNQFLNAVLFYLFYPKNLDLNFIYPIIAVKRTPSFFSIFVKLIPYSHPYSNE